MPSASAVHRCLGKKKGHLSHREIMAKRHEKKKKKEKKNSVQRKKELLEQYSELNKKYFSSRKNTSMKIMELVEDINENGGKMNDKHYLDIMDLLMALNKGTMYTDPPVRRTLDYYYDTTGDYYERENSINTPYGIGVRARTSNVHIEQNLDFSNRPIRTLRYENLISTYMNNIIDLQNTEDTY